MQWDAHCDSTKGFLEFPAFVIIENADSSSRDRIFNLLINYINSSGYVRIVRDDIDVFTSYYEIQFKEKGSTTSGIVQGIDFNALIAEYGQPLSMQRSSPQYEMRYCRFCGKAIPSDSVFCPACGKQLN